MKILKIVILVLLISLLVGVGIEKISLKVDSGKYTPVGSLVEVDEKKMHIFGVGSGENTIVLIPTWDTGGLIMNISAVNAIENQLRSGMKTFIDQFLNDYLTVNPKT